MTTESRPKGEAFAHGDAFHAECKTVVEFIDSSVRPIVDRRTARTLEHDTFVGALLRVVAWLRSVERLNHPGDFQAVCAGSRALFEITVDLTLLVHDPKGHPGTLLLTWERSAKLHAAERVIQLFQHAQKPLPREQSEPASFVTREGAKIRAERTATWGNGSHPQRWTGKSLDQDAALADKFASHGLAEFYATRFAQLCWNTHGSGLAGVRMVSSPLFPGLTALSLGECARFAVVIAELVLRAFDAFDSIAEARLARLERERLATRMRVLVSYPEAESLFQTAR